MSYCRTGQRRAFFGREVTGQGHGFCFALSASKARAIIYRSARDAGSDVRWQDIKVHRAPALDGRIPGDYRNQFYALDQIKNLPMPSIENTERRGVDK